MGSQCGAVAFVQRFGSRLNLHPHVRVIVLEGGFAGLEEEPFCWKKKEATAVGREKRLIKIDAV